MNTKIVQKAEIALIIFAITVYAIGYAGRVIYAANLAVISEYTGFTNTQAGWISTGLYITYGLGQFVNGVFCRKYNPKLTILVASIGSALCNILFGLIGPFEIKLVCWIFNGIFQSFFYSTLTFLASIYLTKKNTGKWVIAMGATTAIGSFIAYGISTIFANEHWPISFYIIGALLVGVSIVWVIIYSKIQPNLINREAETVITDDKGKKTSGSIRIYLIALCFTFGLAVCSNILKDGIISWVPTYLKETFSITDSISILITLLLPVLSIVSTILYVKLNDKIKSYPIVIGIFSLMIILAISGIALGANKNIIASTICLTIAGVMACGINGAVTGGIPFSLKKYKNAGTTGGIVDSFCYIGSALSGFALGAIIDNYGVDSYILTILIISGIELLVCSCFSIFWHKKIDDAS